MFRVEIFLDEMIDKINFASLLLQERELRAQISKRK